MKHIFSVISLLYFSIGLVGQISFEKSDIVHKGNSYYSGVAIAVTDMNGDFLDDVIHMDQGRDLYVRYQTAPGAFEHVVYAGRVSNASQWSMAVADLDNDGLCEILVAGAWDGVKVYKPSRDSRSFSRSVLPFEDFLAQCSNLADINNDGFLDAFICDDNSANHIGINDSTGHFVAMDSLIDFSTDPPTDRSGNYGSTWTDFDLDGDLDLYIAKCRQGVEDSSDPRRINMLMVNDGHNRFANMADSFGLASGEQSWSADFGDIDNDGDLDAVIANHYADLQLMINDGNGYFEDEAMQRGAVIEGFPIQSLFRDFNNDGYLDLLIAGTSHFLFENQGDGTFVEVEDPLGPVQMESCAIGDLNGDLFPDIYAGYADIFTNPSDDPDKVWLNLGNENHAVRIKLLGTQSNRDGVGARIELYSDLGMQMREVRAGESYGISNSLVQHFGLGPDEVVDSVVVHWPSGLVDRYNIWVDESFLLQEGGECVSVAMNVTSESGDFILCQGDSLRLMGIPHPGAELIWNTGDTSSALNVNEQGIYQYRFKDASGCVLLSDPAYVAFDPDETPDLAVEGNLTFCQGGHVTLGASESPNYEWSTGETTPVIGATESGTYFVKVEGKCRDFYSDSVSVLVLEVEDPLTRNDTIVEEGEAGLQAIGDSILWYESTSAADPVAWGDSLDLGWIDSSLTYFAENVALFPGDTFSGGEIGHRGPSFYNGATINGGLRFDVIEDIRLLSVTVYTEFEGRRAIVIANEGTGFLWRDTFLLAEGPTVLMLDLLLPAADDYFITTDAALNEAELGMTNPRLWRNEAATAFPYEVGKAIEILESNYGTDYYYYFYHWRTEEEDRTCRSGRIPVQAVVLKDVGIDEIPAFPVTVYPNPFDDQLVIESEEQIDHVRLRDLQGRAVWTGHFDGRSSLVIRPDLAPGIYILECRSGQKIARVKLISN